MEILFGSLGIAGGILCLIGDVLLDYKGKGNKTLGKYKFIESKWDNMANWRFKASIPFASAGVPLYFLGFTALAMQISSKPLALCFWIACIIGSVGGVFMHGLLCVFPVLYKTISENRAFEETEGILNTVINLIKLPFFFHHFFLVIASSVLAGYAVIGGYLSLPIWTVIFMPLCMMILGLVLKTVTKRDFPGTTSFGIAMVGLMAILNYTL